MIIRLPNLEKDSTVWLRIIHLSITLFFVFLADAILSFWTPNFMQKALGSPMAMGLVMSFSSIIGLGADLIFPQVARGITVKRLIALSVITSTLFALCLLWTTLMPFLLIFLLAMAIWGVYYELLGFAQQQFVADSIPLNLHSAAWGLLNVFRSLAYFTGPLLVGLFVYSDRKILFLAFFFLLISAFSVIFSRKQHVRPVAFDLKEVNLFTEAKHWYVLFRSVWPMVLMSLYLEIIGSVFWTTGTVYSETLAQKSVWGNFFVPFYTLPSIVLGLIMARMQIFHGKKKLSELFLIFSGLSLMLLMFSTNIYFQLAMVFIAGIMTSVAYPLVDGVYSDIVTRMGRERRHLIGLSRSTISIAYIIGPILAGFIASRVGELETFVIIGGIAMLLGLFLLILTPRRLLLPQKDIKTWND